MKKKIFRKKLHLMSLLCAALLTAGLLACPVAASDGSAALADVLILRKNGTNTTTIPNPWSETDDLEEACEGSGIAFTDPVEQAIPDGLSRRPYRYMEDMLEVIYADDTDELTIRVSTEREELELTGDYNKYSKEWDEVFKGLRAHCSGDGETINVALFDGTGVHFAVMYNTGEEGRGLTPDQLKSLVMCMQASPLA